MEDFATCFITALLSIFPSFFSHLQRHWWFRILRHLLVDLPRSAVQSLKHATRTRGLHNVTILFLSACSPTLWRNLQKDWIYFFFPFLTAGQLHKPRIRQLVDSMIEESDMAQHKNIDKNIEIYQEWSSSCCKGSGILFLNTPSNVSIAMICNTGYCCNKSDTFCELLKYKEIQLKSTK